MQAIPQDISLLIAGLTQGEGASTAPIAASQVVDKQLEKNPLGFFATFQESLNSLVADDALEALSPELLLSLEALIGQSLTEGGNVLPLNEVANTLDATGQLPEIIQALPASQLQELARFFKLASMSENKGTLESVGLDTKARTLGPADMAILQGQIMPAQLARQAESMPVLDRPGMLMPEAEKVMAVAPLNMFTAQETQKNKFLKLSDVQTRAADDALKLQQDSNKLLPEKTLRNTELSDFMQKMVVTNQRVQRPVDGVSLNGEQKSDVNLLGLQQGPRAVTTAMSNIAEAKPVQSFIPSPLEGSQWTKQFTDRVIWLAKDGVQTAEIRLNPQHMGPIQVRVIMNDDVASVTLVAQNHAVREAMESSLPRLREMFTATGLQLSDAQVSDQSLQQQNRERRGEHQQDGANEQLSNVDTSAEALVSELDLSAFEPPPDISNGLDLYA